MMKKHQKARKFMLSAIASSLLAMPAVVSAEKVTISQEPLLGVSKVIPSVVLALSVEFPTTYIAYNDNVFNVDDAKKEYLGYFDSNTCYQYVVTSNATGNRLGDGYFQKTRTVERDSNGYVGMCDGANEWSGNMLNWATMSALDIFRQTLTGGNRAKGVGSNPQVYEDGDKNAGANKAYLRRSMMWTNKVSKDDFPNKTEEDQLSQNEAKNTRYRYFDQKVYENGLINKLVPEDFAIVKAGKANYGWLVVKTQSGKYYTNKNGNASGDSWWETTESWHKQIADQVDANGRPAKVAGGSVALKDIVVFENSATGFYAPAQLPWFNVVVEKSEKPIGILQEKADMRTAAMGYLPEYQKVPNTENEDRSAGDGGVLRARMARVMDKEVNADGSFVLNPYPADASASGVVNSGVINYVNKFGDNAPYDTRDPVAELYYTAIRYLRNGAWKWVAEGTGEKNSNQSRNGSAGALPYTLPNPLTEMHKDGFPVITTWDDPLKAPGDVAKDMQCYAPSIIVLGDTNTHYDNNLPNYPTASGITDNVALDKDGATKYYQKVCRLSGFCPDTDGTSDWRVSSGGWGPGNNYGGDDHAPTFGMAGMAYWVKTNDARPDIVRDDGKPTHISSFFIDVLEGGHPKTGDVNTLKNDKRSIWWTSTPAKSDKEMANAYYFAGKFASPDYEESKTYTAADFDSTNETTRSLWTSDPIGASSNALFTLGIPKNFAVANEPENMKNALIQAFKTVGFTKNTMQSGIQYNTNGELQISGSGGSESLIGTVIEKTTNSDGSETYQIKDTKAITDKAEKGEVPLALRAGYRFSQRTGYLIASVLLPGVKDANGVMSGLVEVPVWEAGEILYNNYHKPSDAYKNRNVWSKTGENIVSGFTKLEPSNTDLQALVKGNVFEENTNYFTDRTKLTMSAANAENLIKYVLGDSSQEGKGLRQRKDSLLGTSVYSSVTPILRNTEQDFVRTVPLGATNEKTCYYSAGNLRKQDYAAMSSNEGMLHIFDMAGNEKMAYMPQTALPYLANFASPDYEIRDHRFVNDGTSVLHEVCEVGSDGKGVAKTYLVGTSGRGASSIYAIDVTGESNFNPVLEINAKTDPDIGILVSGPLVVNDGNNTPVMIFSSGYNPKSNKDEGYLFFYNLKTGAEIAKVKLGGSGVGAPFGYDTDGDGVADRIYVGDHDGNIWRVNRNGNTWGGATSQELFKCAGSCQPITGRPVVGRVPNGKVVVLAGTGEYFSFDDMRGTPQNYAYGIFDDEGTATVLSNDTEGLLLQEFGSEEKTSKVDKNLTYMSITQNALDQGKHKGWMLKLPEGYVVSSDSGFYGPKNQVAVYTATKIDNVGNLSCNVSGDTLFIAVDAQNGGAYSQSLFDVNNDGKFNGSDFVGVGSAGAVHIKGRLMPYLTIATTSAGTYARGDDGQGAGGGGISPSGGDINIPLAPWLSSGTVRRVSWREIF